MISCSFSWSAALGVSGSLISTPLAAQNAGLLHPRENRERKGLPRIAPRAIGTEGGPAMGGAENGYPDGFSRGWSTVLQWRSAPGRKDVPALRVGGSRPGERGRDALAPGRSQVATQRASSTGRYGFRLSGTVLPCSSQNFAAPGCRGTEAPRNAFSMFISLKVFLAVTMASIPSLDQRVFMTV